MTIKYNPFSYNVNTPFHAKVTFINSDLGNFRLVNLWVYTGKWSYLIEDVYIGSVPYVTGDVLSMNVPYFMNLKKDSVRVLDVP